MTKAPPPSARTPAICNVGTLLMPVVDSRAVLLAPIAVLSFPRTVVAVANAEVGVVANAGFGVVNDVRIAAATTTNESDAEARPGSLAWTRAMPCWLTQVTDPVTLTVYVLSATGAVNVYGGSIGMSPREKKAAGPEMSTCTVGPQKLWTVKVMLSPGVTLCRLKLIVGATGYA